MLRFQEKRHSWNLLASQCVVAWLVLSALAPCPGNAQDLIHTVQSGETLTQILAHYHKRPVYGKNGSLIAVIIVNSKLVTHQGNKIFPGDQILIPGSESPSEQERALASMTTETTAVIEPTPITTCTPSLPNPMPSLLPEPLATTAPKTHNDSIPQYSELSIQPSFAYHRIDALDPTTQSRALLLSKMNPGLQFAWKLFPGGSIHPYFRIATEKVAYEEDSSRRITTTKTLRSSFSAGAEIKASRKFHFTLSGTTEETPYLKAVSATQLQVDFVRVFSTGAVVTYTFYSEKNIEMSSSVSLSYRFSSTATGYTVKNGRDFGFQLGVRQFSNQKHESYLGGSIFYRSTFQDSTIHKSRFQNSGLQFEYGWRFGE